MAPFVALGTLVGLYLLWSVLHENVTAHVVNNTIQYGGAGDHAVVATVLYVIATCAPPMLSSHTGIVIFGVLDLFAVAVIVWVQADGLTSIWCLWAAVVSVLIYAQFVAWRRSDTSVAGARRAAVDRYPAIRREARRLGSGQRTWVAHPRRSKSRMIAADVSSWPRSTPCRASVGNAWCALCHDSPIDSAAIGGEVRALVGGTEGARPDGVAQRVRAPRDVVEQPHADEARPQERGEATAEAAGDGVTDGERQHERQDGQRHEEAVDRARGRGRRAGRERTSPAG